MPWFHQTLKVADLVPENLKKNHVGKVIEEEGLVRWKKSLSIFFKSTYMICLISDVPSRIFQFYPRVSRCDQGLHIE